MRSARNLRGTVVRALSLLVLLVVSVPAPAQADILPAPALNPVSGHVKANPRLAWESVPRAARYQVQISASSTFTGSPIYNVTVYGTSVTPVTELPLGTLYWRVASHDGGSELGAYSPGESFTKVQADAPVQVAPQSDAALNYPADPAVLSWNPIPGMKTYTVQLDDEQTFTNPPMVYSTSATSLSLPAALPLGVTRYWRVQGVSNNPLVTSEWSTPRSFSIVWPQSARPTLLAPVDGLEPSLDDVDFTWTPVTGASKYQIEISNSSEFTTRAVAQTVSGTSYRPPSTLDAGSYFWRVRAQQGSGNTAFYSAWSAVSKYKRAWLDLQGLPARPTIALTDANPISETSVEVEEDQVYISWTPVPRATYYVLEISTDPSFNNETTGVKRTCRTPHAHWTPYVLGTYTPGAIAGQGACAFAGTSTSNASLNFINPGGTYHVRVQAIDQTKDNQSRASLWSNQARPGEALPAATAFTVIPSSRPGTSIAEPAVPLSSVDSEGSPRLTWDKVAGAEAYMVMLATDESFTTPAISGGYIITPNTELVIKDVLLDNDAGGAYYWFVLPCSRWDADNDPDNVCPVGSEQGQVAGRFATFTKRGKAVAGLTNGTTQTDTVRLSWQDQLVTSPTGGGIRHYEYEIVSGATVVDSGTTDATGHSMLDEALPDGSYTWKVRAVDAAGKKLAQSAAGSFDKRSSVPTPKAPEAGGEMPVLTWEPTAFAASYDVQVFRGSDPTFPAGAVVATASVSSRKYPSYVITSPLKEDTYSWRVRQVDAYGNLGQWSTEMLPFEVGGTAPVQQSPLPAAASPVTGLVFQWSAVPGAVQYRFEVADTEGLNPVDHKVDVVGTQYAPEYAFIGGRTYYWRVHALNGAGDTLATSQESSFLAQTAPLQPLTPSAKMASGAQIKVSWTAPASNGGAPLDGYEVRYKKSTDTEWTEATVAAGDLSLSFGNLEPNMTYQAQVAARNAVGIGRYSAVASVKTPTLPVVPTELTLTPEVRGFNVTWKAPTTPSGGLPITDYVVSVRPTAGGETTEMTVSGIQTRITGLLDLTGYTVDVAAKNDMGTGPKATAQGTTLALPNAPETTIISGPAPGASVATATVSFGFAGTPSANVDHFECRLDAGAVEGEFVPCSSPKQLTGLTEQTYSMVVRAVDKWGQVDATPAKHVFDVDLTAPDTEIVTAPSSGTTDTTAAFSYSGAPSADADRFECKLDGAAFSACPAGGRNYPGLARGEHGFAVRAIDKAGNVDATPATHAWTIAAAVLPPVPTVAPTPVPTVAPTPAPTVTPPGTAHLAAGLARLPGTARSKDGKSFSFTLPAGALPAGTVVTVKLTGAGLGTAGMGRAAVRAGTATRVIVKLSAKARKALEKKRKLKLKLTGTATEADGDRATKSKTLILRGRR